MVGCLLKIWIEKLSNFFGWNKDHRSVLAHFAHSLDISGSIKLLCLVMSPRRPRALLTTFKRIIMSLFII